VQLVENLRLLLCTRNDEAQENKYKRRSQIFLVRAVGEGNTNLGVRVTFVPPVKVESLINRLTQLSYQSK
jgi:hypothetical protein